MIGGQPVWCGSACGVIFIMLAGVRDRLLIEKPEIMLFLYIIIGALGIGLHTAGNAFRNHG